MHSSAREWGRQNGLSSKLLWFRSRANALNSAPYEWKITLYVFVMKFLSQYVNGGVIGGGSLLIPNRWREERKTKVCFFRVLRLPRGLCCCQANSSIDIIRGVEGTFVRNVKVITKERGTECVTLCVEDVPSSTYTVTVMRRLQDFTKRLLFINKLKGKSVVHTFHVLMVISLDWVPLPRKMSLLLRETGPVAVGVGPQRGAYIVQSFTHGPPTGPGWPERLPPSLEGIVRGPESEAGSPDIYSQLSKRIWLSEFLSSGS